jgi:hypothetical protein
MRPAQLIRSTSEWLETWFISVKSRIDSGSISVSGEYSFPGILRIGESSNHYIIELTGASEISSSLEYHLQVPNSTEKVVNSAAFLNPGPQIGANAAALLTITSHDNAFSHLVLATPFDETVFQRHINVPLSGARINASFEANALIMIADAAYNLIFRDIDLVRSVGPQIFFRRISTALVVRKSTTKKELFEWLNRESQKMLNLTLRPDILGLNLDYSVSKEGFAVQLLSLSHQAVAERTIDSFIQHNQSFFAEALGYEAAFSQRVLKIINSTGLEGVHLQPDYLMIRQDGGCDILDLKKALIPPVTVGAKNRIRFSAYVTELIGQLEGYRRYFSAPENAQWVRENLGIAVTGNLRLIGVVGNHNNFERDNVDLAIGAYRDDLAIISYSEVVDLLRK